MQQLFSFNNVRIKLSSLLFLFVSFSANNSQAHNPYSNTVDRPNEIVKNAFQIDRQATSIYEELNAEGLSLMVFVQAYHGYLSYKQAGLIENENIITLIDFDKNSIEKRLYIIDLEKRKVIYNSYVAHGQGTGELEANVFSNIENSHQSSLGFYLTDEIYTGKHGLSLRLDGLEKGVNDNARMRNIVVHSADYVSEEYIAKNQRLGRSWGCPALPEKDYEKVIDWIKGKSLLYIYSSKRSNRFPSEIVNLAQVN